MTIDNIEQPLNHILRALPEADYAQLAGTLERATLPKGQVLLEPGDPIAWVVFPETAVLSLIQSYPQGVAVETASVGCEGVVGLPAALDKRELAQQRHLVQLGGRAIRMSRDDFLRAFEALPAFREIVLRFAADFLGTVLLSVACNRVHTVDKRLARWLLMMRDRSSSETLPLTHDVLAEMLGVHRPTVSIAARGLEHAGLIRYRRGTVTIVDRSGLEGAACDCYHIARHRRLVDA